MACDLEYPRAHTDQVLVPDTVITEVKEVDQNRRASLARELLPLIAI